MEKQEFINILEEIERLLKLENLEEVVKYIDNKKEYIKNIKEDAAGKYIDSLIKSLE